MWVFRGYGTTYPLPRSNVSRVPLGLQPLASGSVLGGGTRRFLGCGQIMSTTDVSASLAEWNK